MRNRLPLYDEENAQERRRCDRDLQSMANIIELIKVPLRKPLDQEALEVASKKQWHEWKNEMLHLHRLMDPLGTELRLVWKEVQSIRPGPRSLSVSLPTTFEIRLTAILQWILDEGTPVVRRNLRYYGASRSLWMTRWTRDYILTVLAEVFLKPP